MLRCFSGTDLGLNRCRRTDDSGRSHNWFRLSRGNMSLVRRKKYTVFAAGTPHARSRLHTCMFEHVCRKFFCKMNATRQSYREQTVLCMTYQRRERGFRLCGGNRSLTPAISQERRCSIRAALRSAHAIRRPAQRVVLGKLARVADNRALGVAFTSRHLRPAKVVVPSHFFYFFLAVFSVEVCRASENNHSGWAKR